MIHKIVGYPYYLLLQNKWTMVRSIAASIGSSTLIIKL